MKKKTPWWQTLLLVIVFLVLMQGVYAVYQTGDHLQYIIPPPSAADGGNQAIAEWKEELEAIAGEWDATMNSWSFGGIVETIAFHADDGSKAQGRLTLMGERGLQVKPEYLLSGRLFYPEELEKGEPVILLDQQLAFALFRSNEPLLRTVTVGNGVYRVIGVLRHAKQVGDYTDFGAIIPLTEIYHDSLPLDTLVVEADPLPGTGADISFSTVCRQWQGNGTLINLGKEGILATLWLRILVFLIGITATLRFLRWLNKQARYIHQNFRALLQNSYVKELWRHIVGSLLLFFLGYAGVAALAVLLMNLIVMPIYTFTEWIPTVLVDWNAIVKAFWNVWQPAAALHELRSPELVRLRFFAQLIQECTAIAGILLALRYTHILSS